MARLIIISGASGAGKSFSLRNLRDINNIKVEALRKMTTRGPRSDDEKEKNEKGDLDLILNCTREQVRECDYTYNYCDHSYGFKKKDIDQVIAKGLYPAVIVAKCSTIEQIKEDYPNALVLYVQNVLSGEDLKQALIKERDPIEVEVRIERQKQSLTDYVTHVEKKIFDYVLINDFSSKLTDQLDYIFRNELDVNDSNFVFVVMSFKPDYNEIYDAFNHAGQLYTKNNQNVAVKTRRVNCPKCNCSTSVKSGKIKDRQRYKFKECGYNYTVLIKSSAKPKSLKRQALHLYLEGLGFCSIGRLLGFSNVSVLNWIRDFRKKSTGVECRESRYGNG